MRLATALGVLAIVVFHSSINAQLPSHIVSNKSEISKVPSESSSVYKTTDLPKNSFNGLVTDKQTGNPLAGASIYLHEVKMGAVTDANGKFLITDIPSGKYLLEISFQGFSTLIETFEISGNLSRNYALVETFAQTRK